MLNQILIFSGTSEGRKLADILKEHAIRSTVCVATEYGQEVMQESEVIEVRVGRMNQEEMEQLIQSKEWLAVVDATHPYATEVTENIKRACEHQNREVFRLLRSRDRQPEQLLSERIPQEQLLPEQMYYVDSAKEAAAYLNETKGNIFLTTGSKELPVYMELIEDKSRIYARVLPGREELEKCHQLGLKGKQIICMQGPFSEELNLAMMKEIDASWMVTKETAKAGGYPEKLRAARRAGVKVMVIKRPEETGYSMEEILEKLGISEETGSFRKMRISEDETGFPVREIALVGIGMGNYETLTIEAGQTIREAQLLIGASRMIDSIPEEFKKGKAQFIAYKPQEILSYIQKHPQYEKIAVLFSGDVGFYSGVNQLLKQLKEQAEGQAKEEKVQGKPPYQIKLICGISSVVYFASRLQIPWEDMKLMSLHGRNQNVIGALWQNEKVFTLTNGAEGIRALSKALIQYGMEYVKIYLGRQLGSKEEEIEEGHPSDFSEYQKEGLCVLVLVNEKAGEALITHGIADEEFLRDKVPMTKEEVRSISISKLGLSRNSVIYDIGAGTGSISVECAKIAVDGMVYAIEKKPEACKLIEQNKYRLAASNLHIVVGEAPEVLADLPTPTHVFIGGSSGKLEEILNALWEKNPKLRVVLNAISLETIAEVTRMLKKYEFRKKEIVQVTIAKAKEIGNYQMMMGQNPVYVITLQK